MKTVAKTYLYEAFGLTLQSEYLIAQLMPAADGAEVDVCICQADLSGYKVLPDHYRISSRELVFSIADVGTFRVTEGKLVQVHPDQACTLSQLGVYIMGSCMGAVLHQRGLMPLHGSCVTDGTHAVLITGESGAGKSTLAAEFLSRGWKLLTDDVCAVLDPEGAAVVQPSYPSQKLWQDSLDHYGRPESDIHSLYFSEEREKFGVDVRRYFHPETVPLTMIVQLLPTQEPCSISQINAFTAIEQLMQNTYRLFMIPREHQQRHFQRCATLAGKIPMMLLTRQNGVQCADKLYTLVSERLEGMSGTGCQV